jgi:nucleotide-binding universal stress UspA family protein
VAPRLRPAGADAAAGGSAGTARAFEAQTRKAIPAGVNVLTRVPEAPPEEAVAGEARKGYGLLVVGVERSVGPEGGFHEDVARLASGFLGPLAVAVARGPHADRSLEADLRILIPITGTEVSRRGAEVGLALARAAHAPAMALHVAGAGKTARRRFGGPGRGEGEILRHVVGLAEWYGVPLRTAMRVDLAAEDAILRQARLGGHNLIVMGVTRRPGEALLFGNVAAALLESAERSILFVAS